MEDKPQRDEVTRRLTAALTRPLVALIAGARETATIAGWECGEPMPRDVELVLRAALRVVLALQERYSSGRPMITWFAGQNVRLGGQSPADVLARLTEGYDARAAEAVINAAVAFSNR